MKIQHLAVVFILIILPISIVFSSYVGNQIETINIENQYDTRLLNCTYDAIKAYQINTINNTESDVTNSKIADIEASVNAFKSSLVTSFGYSGYDISVMDEYVPAIVYTLYDGYYIYSPYQNTLTETSVYEDDDITYKDGRKINGLKTYVYYSCRFQKGTSDDFVITFTLDNSITIQGIINGEYINESGYLIDGITKVSNTCYEYDGVKFNKGTGNDEERKNQTEQLKEMIGTTMYEYVKLNGTKYYLSQGATEKSGYIFSIINGTTTVQAKSDIDLVSYQSIYYMIKENNLAYKYYEDAYKFTNKIRNELGLKDLNASNAKDENYGNYIIFGDGTSGYIQDENSNFNQFRREVIRNTIETNLRTAIASFTAYSNASSEFAMPKISESDWELIENNVTTISFLQGMKIKSKTYNGYAVVPNTLTKEYVDENAIYLETNDGQYHKSNGNELKSLDLKKNSVGNQIKSSGYLNIDYERRYYSNEKIYYYARENILGSYKSIVGNSEVNHITDMYEYMRSLSNVTTTKEYDIKKEYYTALGRERQSSFKIYNDELLDPIISYELGDNGIIESNGVPVYDFVKKNKDYIITDKKPSAKLEDAPGHYIDIEFKGWTDDPEKLTEVKYSEEKGMMLNAVRKSKKLYAVWGVNQFAVKFEMNINPEDTDKQVTPDSLSNVYGTTMISATLPGVEPTRSMHKFLYWCEDPKGTTDDSKKYYAGSQYNNPNGKYINTLYAIWGELTTATIENLIDYWKIDDYCSAKINPYGAKENIAKDSTIIERGVASRKLSSDYWFGTKSDYMYDYAGKVIVGYDPRKKESGGWGNFVIINGNGNKVAKISAYTEGIKAKDNGKSLEQIRMEFKFNTEYGDSINAAGIMLGVHEKSSTDKNLTSYAISFNKYNESWYKNSSNKYGGLWKFNEYNLKNTNYYFTTINKEDVSGGNGLDIDKDGTMAITIKNWKNNKKKVEIDYAKNGKLDGNPEKTFEMDDRYGFDFGFFAETYSHGCEWIGLFKLTNIEIEIVQL